MSREAFLAAIRADPADDTPRLIFADWLDDQGDEDQAEFIRVQCRLDDLSPADPDWTLLSERHHELAARLSPRAGELTPTLPEGLKFYGLLDHPNGPFRRGFPHLATATWAGAPPEAGGVERVRDAWAAAVARTTFRGLSIAGGTAGQLAVILGAPAAGAMSTLFTQMWGGREEGEELARVIADSPAAPNLDRLEPNLIGDGWRGWFARLADVRTFHRLTRLQASTYLAHRTDLVRLLAAPWWSRLHHLHIELSIPDESAVVVADGLPDLPDLHTLELKVAPNAGRVFAGSRRFPALGRIVWKEAPLNSAGAADLAQFDFPRLRILELIGCELRNEQVGALIKARWFPGLRAIDWLGNEVGDRAVARVVEADPELQAVRLGQNRLGKAGLLALAKLSNLISLHVGDAMPRRKPYAAEVARCLAALARPGLRHLNLSGWRVEDGGAAVLAGSPEFAGLIRLGLARCGIGETGAETLFASPHLQNLIELDLRDNPLGNKADALLDPAVLPRLGVCRLQGAISAATADRLRAARTGVFD